MVATATISVTPIANGFVVADATNDPYGAAEWRVAESVFYPSLDELAADMARFVKAAVEGAAERDREMRERMAANEREGPGTYNLAQRQQARGAIRAPADVRPR